MEKRGSNKGKIREKENRYIQNVNIRPFKSKPKKDVFFGICEFLVFVFIKKLGEKVSDVLNRESIIRNESY